MKRKFSARIKYRIDPKHPDWDYILPEKRNGILDYSDVYTIDDNYVYDPEEYIKENLLLIAGGGYNWKHAHDVHFGIREI